MNTILVMLCVNDPDNGSPSGRIAQLSIDDVIQLEGPCDFDEEAKDLVWTTKFAADRHTITISSGVFPHKGYSEWVGNCCWDAVWMLPADVLALLNHLKALEWTCNEAETSLFKRWREPGKLGMEDLARAGMELEAETR